MAAAAFATVGASGGGAALADQVSRLSGPFIHENLAIYLIHGTSVNGPVPLTLQEALAKGHVHVVETGRVSELQIENTGEEEVFIQAGDIVKGGKQDRVLTVSFLLPGKSGRIPIASLCVEQGRWSARGAESVAKFTSAMESMPSRSALVAMAAPPPAEPPVPAAGPAGVPSAASRAVQASDSGSKQKKVWDEVAKTQRTLSHSLDARMAVPESTSSLQLTLEHEKLKAARAGYVSALETAGQKEDDVIGYIVAINGKLVSADVYPSNGLYRKMWGKQLTAVVTEAIGTKAAAGDQPAAAPKPAAAKEFLEAAEKGKALEREVAAKTRLETRESDRALYNETRRDGKAFHKSYLAK
jgi:hypothetical protein